MRYRSLIAGRRTLSGIQNMVATLLGRLRARRNGASSTPTLSPKEQVTQTYELLEQIFHHLDPHSLRLSQLVSNYWRSIIYQSAALKPRLSENRQLRPVRALLIGAPDVGVDSLATCFATGPTGFPYPYDPTTDGTFRKIFFVDDERWIIDGFSDGYLRPQGLQSYLGHALANSETYILLYSVASRESFDAVKGFLQQMESPTEPLSTMVETKRGQASGKNSDGKCFLSGLVSTKNDLPEPQRIVEPSEGAALARELGCPFIETSAKTGSGVKDAFAEMCRMYKRVWMEQRRQQSKRTSLIKAIVSPSSADAKERKERWWRWYRAKHSER